MPNERFMRHHYGPSGYVDPKPEPVTQTAPVSPRPSAAEFWGWYYRTGKEFADKQICEFAEAYADSVTLTPSSKEKI